MIVPLRKHLNNLYASLREQLRIYASDIWRCICIVLLACVWMGIAPTLYEEMLAKVPEWMNLTYRFFDDNLLLNIPVCLWLIYLCYKMVKRLVPIRFYWSLFLPAFALLILNYNEPPYTYAKIAWGFDYRIFLSRLLEGVLILTIVGKFFRKKRESNETTNKINKEYKKELNHPPCFSPDYDANIKPPEPVKAYAKTIVNRLDSTELEKESFAIGITSEWGAGKTTFLNLLKKEIQARVSNDIVDFNPWMCQSPEQVTRDFFATLRSKLSKNHPELSNPIRQYAKHLGSVSLPVFGIASINLNNFTTEKNLLEMKAKLSEQFSKLGNKVVVVIDDLDRLDSSEVFEVLRLIRNTADLSNMVYLVAYDKSYITEILRKQNISDPAAYLEKIFQLEIQLPKVTNAQVRKTLYSEFHSQLPTMENIKFIRDIEDLIAEILGTYRRTKRFARLFSLSYDMLKRESVPPVVLREKFLLDLLQMDDKKIYDILWDKREKILEKTDKELLVYKEEIAKENEISIKPTTQQLLTLLWPQSDDEPEKYSIRRILYFVDYFTLEVQFSEKDVEQMVNDKDPDTLVEGWKKRNKHIRTSIIKAYCVNNELTESQRKNLIWGVLSACYYSRLNYATALSADLFTDDNIDIIKGWFIKKSEEDEYIISPLPEVLEFLSINNETNLRVIINTILKGFVKMNKNCSILDIIYFGKARHSLGRLFEDFGSENREIAFDCIINYFSKQEQKPTMADFEAAKEKVNKDKRTLNSALKNVYDNQWLQKLDKISEKCIEPEKEEKLAGNDKNTL